MKNLIKLTAIVSAFTIFISSSQAIECKAEYYGGENSPYIITQKKTTVDFVILAYKNNDGNLTITGCYDYDPEFAVNPYSNGDSYGFVAVSVFDRVLEIPSHIDGNLVTEIKNLSGNDTFDTIIVPDAIDKILKTAFCGMDYAVETADNECRIKTLYC